MHTYANDPNKLSRYAALLYPEKTAAEKPENWLARAVREEREAKAAAPVQLADASGADHPEYRQPFDFWPDDEPAAPETVPSLKGDQYRTVWGPLSLEGDKPSDTVTEPGQRELVRSTGEASGGLRPKPELDSVGGSLSVNDAYLLNPIELPENTRVDWKFVNQKEGRTLYGHVPSNSKDGKPIDNSGPTVATGFDLGQWDALGLERDLGLPTDSTLYKKLLPYLGKSREKAQELLKRMPLDITEVEADYLDNAARAYFVRELNGKLLKSPGNERKILFTDLPPEAQTVVYSVAYQNGINGFYKVPGFFQAALSQNWNEATAALERRANDPGYKFKNRRLEEALHLYQGLMGEFDQ